MFSSVQEKINSYRNGSKQKKSQTHVSVQQTAQLQRFIESVEDVVDTVSTAAKMYKKPKHDPEVVDLLCDNAVLALNIFAGSCEEMYKENNKEAIELGTKRAIDKFQELESKNAAVYKLVDQHRKFMLAALAGHKNLKYKKSRVDPTAVDLFENNVSDINAAFGAIAKSNHAFNQRQESFKDAKMSQNLAKDHHAQLNEYRNSKKYKNNTKNNTKYNKPKVSDLYFNDSVKESQFKDKWAAERKEQEARGMDVELMGAEASAYDKLMKNGHYTNAVLLLSKQNTYKYNDTILKKPVPCKMIAASKKNPENMIEIRLCAPYNDFTFDAPANMLLLNETQVAEYEAKHIKKNGKLGDEHHEHLSIKEQQVDFDGDINI